MIGGSGSTEPPRPQYFQVSCAEGHVIRGERTEGYQALRCPHCDDGVFVLPRSPLPLPPTPPSSRPKVRPAKVVIEAYEDEAIEFTEAPPQEDLEEIQWVDLEELEPDVPQPVQEAPVRSPKRRKLAEPQPTPNESDEPVVIPPRPTPKKRLPADLPKPRVKTVGPAPEVIAETDPIEPGRIAVPYRRKRGGDVLLVLTAVVLIVGTTLYFRNRWVRRQELPHEAEVNAQQGKEALEVGRFDEAKIKLGRAAKAYHDLGSSDEAAIEAIQLADEAAIFADFTRYGLDEIIEEVARLGEDEGNKRFKAFYQGRAVLIEDIVESVKDRHVELRRLIFVGRGPVPAKIGKLDVADFELLKNKTLKPDDSVTFGARLDSIRLDGGKWRITLQPSSGVWITNAKAKAIVFPEPQI